MDDTYHIGEVADRVGLSLRTLRHWEDMGLVTPTGRSEGGFRLYGEEDVQRVLLARALKPADFSLEELHEVLRLRDHLATDLDPAERLRSENALKGFLARAELRCKLLRERLVGAELAMNALRQSLSPAPDAEDSPATPLPALGL
jgi:MerR family transcriptional regulator, copper efflux regulator